MKNPNPPGDSLSSAFATVNDILEVFISSFSSAIAQEIAPLVYGGLILSFIVLGIMGIKGHLEAPFSEVAFKMLKSSIIISIALTATSFQAYVTDIFLMMPDEIISSILPAALPTENIKAGGNAVVAVETLLELGVFNSAEYFKYGSVLTNFPPFIYGILLFLGTFMCVIVGLVWLFIAKIVLALMLAIAPIFIVCLLWQSTQQYFWNWLGMVLSTIITSVLVVAVFAIFSNIFHHQLEALVIDENASNLAEAATFVFIGGVCMAVLLAIPGFVTQLTGGAGNVSSGLMRIAKATASGGTSLLSGVKSSRNNIEGSAASKKSNAQRGGQSGNKGELSESASNAYRNYFRGKQDCSDVQRHGYGRDKIKASKINMNMKPNLKISK